MQNASLYPVTPALLSAKTAHLTTTAFAIQAAPERTIPLAT
jgi:hypothetical protein